MAAVLVLGALGPLPARAATLYDPDLTWTTRVTPHFYIHYHQGLEGLAERLAGVAEAVYARETPRFGWAPKGRTHVVLTDQTDLANGLTTVVPYDLVVLNATLPDGDLELMLDVDRWLYMLFLHEYAHVLHLDRGDGIPLGLRRVFGRLPLLFPNLFNPGWMLEGMAVYEETEGTAGGRGRGSLARGVLRAEAADGTLLPLSKADHPLHTWPGGLTPYLYGGLFLEDLAATEGPEAPFELVATYSDNLIPFLLKPNFREALGVDLTLRWPGWQRGLRDGLGSPSPEPAPERLTRSGYGTGGARVAPGGRTVAYSSRTPHDHTRILLGPLDGTGEPRELAWRNGGRALAFGPEGLVFDQPEITGNFRLASDLFLADPASGRVTRLTRGARLRDPDVAPDGRIVAVAVGRPAPGDTALVLLEPGDPPGAPRTLLEMGHATLFAGPRFSPDGTRVAVSVWRPGRDRQIALVDAASGAYRFVTQGPAHHADPAWSPDGRYLVYTADPDGVFNLYALEPATGARLRVTDVTGAALAPEVTPDGTAILFTGLHGGGFDLYRVPFTPAAWPPAAPEPAAAPPPAPVAPAPEGAPTTRPYRPYPAALPRFWVPVAYEEGPDAYYGLFTLGLDPLGHHIWLLQAAADVNEGLVEAGVTYLYDRFYPTVQVTLSQTYQGRVYLPGGALGGWPRQRDGTVDLVFPVNHVNHRERLRLGVGVEDDSVKLACAACAATNETTDLFLRLGAEHDSTQRYGLGISETDGRRLAVHGEIASDRWGSDRTGTATLADWAEYAALPWRAQVLSARATGAFATGDLLFTAGGPPGGVVDPFDRDLALRGFPDVALVGERLVRETVEWRFPLALPEWAPGTLPLFLEKLHGAVFTETAQSRRRPAGWKHVWGGGAEVGLDLVAGYFLPLTVRVGVARGLGDRGEGQLYARVAGSFY